MRIFQDYTEFMVLALQLDDVSGEFPLGVDNQKAIAGDCIALVASFFVSTCFPEKPGIVPAGEPFLFRSKDPKPVMLEGMDGGRTNSLCSDKAR